MKETKTVQMVSGAAVLHCPLGKELRVVAVLMALGGTQDGNQAQVVVQWQDQVAFRSATNGMLAVQTEVAAGIGLAPNSPIQLTLIATAFDYGADMLTATMPLPDLWLQNEITVLGLTTTGSVASGSVLYELRDGKRG